MQLGQRVLARVQINHTTHWVPALVVEVGVVDSLLTFYKVRFENRKFRYVVRLEKEGKWYKHIHPIGPYTTKDQIKALSAILGQVPSGR